MALFHFTVTQTKRSKGQSAIASAAYRSGEKLYSEYYGECAERKKEYIKSWRDMIKSLCFFSYAIGGICLNMSKRKEQPFSM